MKNILFNLFIFTYFGFCNYAQTKENSWKKIEAAKISYLTNELSLSPEKAELFWPVYNNYSKQTKKLKLQKNQSIVKKLKNQKEAIDTESAKKYINQFIEIDKKLHLLKIKYYKKSIEILGHKKALQLKMAEIEFNRKIFKKYKK